MLLFVPTNERLTATSADGTATLVAPPGRYVLWATVHTGRSEVSLLMWPHFEVTGSATVRLDTCLSGPPSPRWNYGPFLPNARFERMGDALRIIAGVADQSGHRGLAASDIRDGRFTLYRDGVRLAETSLDAPGFHGLPVEKARYRLEFDGSFATLLPGTFHAAWTFESDSEPAAPPALNVRFTPLLDPTNHAPAGRTLTLPIEVSGGQATTVTVDVSFDAGVTWQPTPVRRSGGGWVTEVTPPPGAPDISLRAHAADATGNMVDQTTTRAIPLR